MPQRQSTTRVDASAVQGDGAYVVLRKLTLGEIKALRVATGGDSDKIALTEDMVREHLVEWNWADDNGVPLPQPTDPAVFDNVTDDELTFLAQAIAGSVDQRKN